MTFVRCDPKSSQRTLTTTYLVIGCSYKVDSRDDDKCRQLHLLQVSLESLAFVIVIMHGASKSPHWGKCSLKQRSTIDRDASWHWSPEIWVDLLLSEVPIEVISSRMKQPKVFSF
jgi:hypothetical protein